MSIINLYPSRDEIARFGTLAYVPAEERKRIMDLPAGASHGAIERLKAKIKEEQRAEDKREKDDEASISCMPSGGARRQMSEIERKWVDQLKHVSFQLGSRDKPFIATMSTYPDVTEKQVAYIRALTRKYRRQINI